MADIAKVIDRLQEQTKQNKVLWQSTTSTGPFIAVIGNVKVSIALPGANPLIAPVVQFRIMDKAGKVVQELNADYSDDTPAIYTKLRELHRQARQSVQGNAGAWDELLAELERV